MKKEVFIDNFRNAFGNYELPIAFWYSDKPVSTPQKTAGCFIAYLKSAREGEFVSLDENTISCRGGKVYTGYTEATPSLHNFVSEKERYKVTSDLVSQFINDLKISSKSERFLNFVSIDKVENFEDIEGLIFFATPDVLSGLVSWVLFDTNSPDAVSAPFGSGCSSMIAQTVVENQNNGHRSFLGLFDPSVRPHVESNILTLSIPMSRFKKLYYTFNESCLQGTHAWKKVKQRIENGI
ncbi:MAG: DUF169 domain-containing protein [Paludibacteraceae bacterium]|nr:DUF169 domain-containing protein [Paludibacteraceae bacterium]